MVHDSISRDQLTILFLKIVPLHFKSVFVLYENILETRLI